MDIAKDLQDYEDDVDVGFINRLRRENELMYKALSEIQASGRQCKEIRIARNVLKDINYDRAFEADLGTL